MNCLPQYGPAPRRVSASVRVGHVVMGGSAPIVVQSMTNTDTADVDATVQQVAALARAGSELVRITVNNAEAAAAVPHIRDALGRLNLNVPLVGDFGGPKTIRAIGAYVNSLGTTVSAFYVSTVEPYLKRAGSFPAFCASVATLPLDDASVFIRLWPASPRRSFIHLPRVTRFSPAKARPASKPCSKAWWTLRTGYNSDLTGLASIFR